MRPHKLTMSAFGPYANQVVVEMDKLGQSGLYLITGDTGAGKTTIFDGITYALYGDASGNYREPSMFRSKYAKDDMKTFVELEFSYGNNRYVIRRNPEYDRPAKRGDGMVKQKAEAELIKPDGSVITKTKEVDEAIREIMGIDRKQFTQIAMIAQGDFMKLLHATTSERQEIFRHIFKTELFEKVQRELQSEALKLRNKCLETRNSMNQFLAGIEGVQPDLPAEEVLAVAGELLAEDEKQVLKLAAEVDGLDVKLEAVNERLLKAEAYLKAKSQFDDTASKIGAKEDNLQSLKIKMADAEEGLTKKEKLDLKISEIKSILPKYDELENLEISWKKSIEDGEKADGAMAEKQAESDLLRGEIDSLKEELKGLEDAGTEKLKLTAELNQAKEKKEKLTKVSEAAAAVNMKEKELKIKQEKYLALAEKAKLSGEEYHRLNRMFLDEQAGILAEALEDGKPCPVCGSVTHPAKAAKSKEAPTEAQLQIAKEQFEEDDKAAKDMSDVCAQFKGILETEKVHLQDLLFGLNLTSVQEVDELIKEETGKIKDLEGRIKEEEKREKRKIKVSELIPEKEKLQTALNENVTALKEEKISLVTKAEHQLEQINGLKGQLTYEDKKSVVELQKKLEDESLEIERAYKKAEKDLRNCEQELATLKGAWDEQKKQLEEGCEIDYEEELKLKNEAVSAKKSKLAEKENLTARIKSNKAAMENAEIRKAELAELEEKYIWVNSLHETANGGISKKEKIMLETYIQMRYFDRVILKANRRLMIMTGNQYELRRSQAAENYRSKIGLDLEVIDHYNGSIRNVRTLSGGESFKASLSLALGLADEIQESAGGIRIDTMFVDEGFGSLDEESLRQAINALAGLAEGNRLVGIISHVGELKEKIDRQIIVKKKAGISEVEII